MASHPAGPLCHTTPADQPLEGRRGTAQGVAWPGAPSPTDSARCGLRPFFTTASLQSESSAPSPHNRPTWPTSSSKWGKGSTDRHDERMVNPAVLGDGQSAPRSVGVAHGAPWPTGRYVPIRACRPRTAIGGTMADGHDRSCSGIASHLGRVTSLAGTNLPHVGAGSGPGRSTL